MGSDQAAPYGVAIKLILRRALYLLYSLCVGANCSRLADLFLNVCGTLLSHKNVQPREMYKKQQTACVLCFVIYNKIDV